MNFELIKKIFNKNYPQQEGIFYCLPEINNQIKKIEVETYSKRAANFKTEQMLQLSPDENKLLNPLRKLPPKSLILETGGGNGRFAFQLMKEGYQVIESDIAPGSVQKVKHIAEENNITNGIYAVIDAENLPFKNNSLDAIFMVASLHHLPDLNKAITQFNRCLKPNGTLLILHEPARWQYILFLPLMLIFRWIIRKRDQHLTSLADDVTWGFTPRNFKKLFGENFKDIQIIPVDYLKKYYTNWLILKKKLKNQEYQPNPKIIKKLTKIDQTIAKIPVLNKFPWDWDLICYKK